MADGAAIEAPFTLASLPKPFDSTNGSIFAAPVFGLRGQKWRKRPEVVASVDGDSVTIYNVSWLIRVFRHVTVLTCSGAQPTIGNFVCSSSPNSPSLPSMLHLPQDLRSQSCSENYLRRSWPHYWKEDGNSLLHRGHDCRLSRPLGRPAGQDNISASRFH